MEPIIMNIFNLFEQRIKSILAASHLQQQDGQALDLTRLSVEAPRDSTHGDLATNAAMILSKSVGVAPRILAERIVDLLRSEMAEVSDITIAGPGFINIRLGVEFWQKTLEIMVQSGTDYGRSNLGQGKKINVEYVSANPTGPLHVGHCRGAVVGDVLANLLKFASFDVTKEYYINDAGGQVEVLARSSLLRYREALGETIEIAPGLYPGEYLKSVGEALYQEFGASLLEKDEAQILEIAKTRAIAAMMALIREDLATLNVHHDVFFSEASLYEDEARAIRTTINDLTLLGFIYKGKLPPPKGKPAQDWEDREQLLLRSTDVGDDMDRPLMKSDGSYTYFASDVAYAKNKYERGFDEMIYVLGADHGGYVKRLEAVAKAVSEGKANLSVLLCQIVKLYRHGEQVTMSKRSGNFVTLRDVVDEVGRDPVRFMMLYRKCDAPLDFDFAKVTEQSKDNPVFYVQYANARCHSIFRQASESLGLDCASLSPQDFTNHFALLQDESEMGLIKKLAEYPRLIEAAARYREPHRLAFYLYELASHFHAHWNKGNDDISLRFIQANNRELTLARLGLVRAVGNIVTCGLGIIGANAPTEMR